METQLPQPPAPTHALSALEMRLLAHAIALDQLFYRTAKDAASSEGLRSSRTMRKALRAQDLCRKALKVLLALRAARRNFKNRTNELLAAQNFAHRQALAARSRKHGQKIAPCARRPSIFLPRERGRWPKAGGGPC